jgi:hypothetical protein
MPYFLRPCRCESVTSLRWTGWGGASSRSSSATSRATYRSSRCTVTGFAEPVNNGAPGEARGTAADRRATRTPAAPAPSWTRRSAADHRRVVPSASRLTRKDILAPEVSPSSGRGACRWRARRSRCGEGRVGLIDRSREEEIRYLAELVERSSIPTCTAPRLVAPARANAVFARCRPATLGFDARRRRSAPGVRHVCVRAFAPDMSLVRRAHVRWRHRRLRP